MRIRCADFEEFVDNLRAARVYRGVVHYSRFREPLNGQSRRDATSWSVQYLMSCVLEFDDGGQALLEATELCGYDRETADGDSDGSARQQELHAELSSICDERGLRMLPGIIDLT